jgi:hypothetical protein
VPANTGSVLPPTSSPCDIFHNLWEEVQRGDLHSAAIERNKLGILKGISLKVDAGIITTAQAAEINAILSLTQVRYTYQGVAHLAKEVPVAQRAHPLSLEHTIDALPRAAFDVISLRR